MSEPKAIESETRGGSCAPAPCSAELPERDGYYWMLNTVDEGRAIWRIVNVFSRGHPERNGMQRIARDCCSVLTQEDLSDWQGVEFHGPLIPPNAAMSDRADSVK